MTAEQKPCTCPGAATTNDSTAPDAPGPASSTTTNNQCRDCGRTIYFTHDVPSKERHAGHGLCDKCAQFHRYHGTIDQFPRTRRSYEETYKAYMALKKDNPNISWTEAGKILGVTRGGVRMAVVRYEKRALKAMGLEET